jgi:two-component system, NarL family, nitrate/nitrite response regulator NarL
MRILICDDHALFAEGLRLILEGTCAKLEVAVCASAEDGLAHVAAQPCDVLLLDWHLRGLSGETALLAFRDAAPEATIVIVSGERDLHLVHKAIELGAAGFIPKDSSREEFRSALRGIAHGTVYLPPAALDFDRQPGQPPAHAGLEVGHAFPALTPRQCDVLRAMIRGHSNKLIARELDLSPATVKSHLKVVFEELGVHSRAEAVYVAARRGVRIH